MCFFVVVVCVQSLVSISFASIPFLYHRSLFLEYILCIFADFDNFSLFIFCVCVCFFSSFACIVLSRFIRFSILFLCMLFIHNGCDELFVIETAMNIYPCWIGALRTELIDIVDRYNTEHSSAIKYNIYIISIFATIFLCHLFSILKMELEKLNRVIKLIINS